MKLKLFINKAIQRAVYRYRADSKSYVAYLRKIGVELGEDVNFYSPTDTEIDIQNPHLIKIGNSVHITSGVKILTHDFSWSVLKKKYGEVLGASGEVYIGDNCFIGVNTVILRNTYIGENVIIGANSLVHGKIPSNSVIAGNPARVIMSLDEYYKKRKSKQDIELMKSIKDYKDRFGYNPDIDVLSEYFWLFTDNKEELTEKCRMQMKNCGNEEYSYMLFTTNNPKYSSINEAINQALLISKD